MTQTLTLVETLERSFEKSKKCKAETLAHAVSNELMTFMPRICEELFERKRMANVDLSQKCIDQIHKNYYLKVRLEYGWEKPSILAEYDCNADLPVFMYAEIPGTKEIILSKTGIITCEENQCYQTREVRGISIQSGWSYMMDNNSYDLWKSETDLGTTTFNVKSIWTAPFNLDVCVKVPEIPSEIINLGDEALLIYFSQAKKLKIKGLKNSPQKPKLAILWAPTDEALYCSGEIPVPPPETDPALILEIPDGEKKYRHVIATWNIGEEYPLKNWLAEYSE